jgi:predicted dehydrogenase
MRLGLVGTGYWATTTHAPALATTPGARLASVWGRDGDAAAALAARHDATAYDDFDAFLGSVDAVSFAVPPDVQAPLAIRAAEAGKHLLLEKPVALSVADADAVVTAVEKAGVASVVFFTWRFNREIRAWLADEQARGGWSGSGWSGGVAVWLGTALTDDSPYNTPWRQRKGALWDLGPHLVAMLWACLGPVTSVSAVRGRGDVRHLVLQHEGGASSTTTMAMDAPEPAEGFNLFVWGAAGRSIMPSIPDDPEQSLRVAASELIASANSGQPYHPCGVRFGRDIVMVLAEAEAQLSTLSSGSNHPRHCTYVRVSA